MPIYEYYCPDNHTVYSFLARRLALAGKTPRCPANPAFRMERMVSRFSVPRRAAESTDAARDEAMDDPRLAAAMAEMEREFAGMDEANPDPRKLARMLRRMSDLSGEKMPAQMEEMIRRMEAGEDPEKLEAEYGEAFDEMEEPPADTTAEGDAGSAKTAEQTRRWRATLRRLRDQPRRDPVLYDMSDYVD